MLTIDKAREMGAEAFKKGAPCVPASDRRLIENFRGHEVGSSIPYLSAWIKGWTEENLRGSAYE